MSTDFTNILPYEITAKEVVFHLNATDTLALACSSKTAWSIIELAASCPQKEITLDGKEITIVFNKDDQTMAVLLFQKKKVELLLRNPTLFYPLDSVRFNFSRADDLYSEAPVKKEYSSLHKGYQNLFRILENLTMSISELSYEAISNPSLGLPLILFDARAQHVNAIDYTYNLKDLIEETLIYPECLALMKIVFHHCHQQRKVNVLPPHDIVTLIIKASNVKYNQDNDSYYNPDVVPWLISLLKDANPSPSSIVTLLETAIKNNDLKLFQEILSFPDAENMQGDDVAKLLLAALNLVPSTHQDSPKVLKNRLVRPIIIEALLLRPDLKNISCQILGVLIETALYKKNQKLVDALLKFPNEGNLEKNSLVSIMKAAFSEGKISILQKFLSHSNTASISREDFSQLLFHAFSLQNQLNTETWKEMVTIILSHPTSESILGAQDVSLLATEVKQSDCI